VSSCAVLFTQVACEQRFQHNVVWEVSPNGPRCAPCWRCVHVCCKHRGEAVDWLVLPRRLSRACIVLLVLSSLGFWNPCVPMARFTRQSVLSTAGGRSTMPCAAEGVHNHGRHSFSVGRRPMRQVPPEAPRTCLICHRTVSRAVTAAHAARTACHDSAAQSARIGRE
jgi:hypothetical protein